MAWHAASSNCSLEKTHAHALNHPYLGGSFRNKCKNKKKSVTDSAMSDVAMSDVSCCKMVQCVRMRVSQATVL